MRRLGVLFILLLLLHVGPAGGEEKLSSILEGIRAQYGTLPGLAVGYNREIITGTMAMLGEEVTGDKATGTIYFKPPHFLKIDQETPKPEVVVTDGETLWWYLPHKNQAHRYPVRTVGQELKLMGDILYGLRKVEESFEIMLAGRDEDKRYRLQLIPNPPWPQTDHVFLAVMPENYCIALVEIHNQLGNVTRFLLDTPPEKKELDEALFQFQAPPGTKIIQEGE